MFDGIPPTLFAWYSIQTFQYQKILALDVKCFLSICYCRWILVFFFFQFRDINNCSIYALELNFSTNNGYMVDIWITGTMIFGLVVVISNFKITTFSYSTTPVTLFVVWGSIILYVISVVIVNLMQSSELYNDFAEYQKFFPIFFSSS